VDAAQGVRGGRERRKIRPAPAQRSPEDVPPLRREARDRQAGSAIARRPLPARPGQGRRGLRGRRHAERQPSDGGHYGDGRGGRAPHDIGSHQGRAPGRQGARNEARWASGRGSHGGGPCTCTERRGKPRRCSGGRDSPHDRRTTGRRHYVVEAHRCGAQRAGHPYGARGR